MTNIETNTNTSTLAADLHALIGQYLDGLITVQELCERIAVRGSGKPEREQVIPDPSLQAAFTETGIQSLLARIQGTPYHLDTRAAAQWKVSPAGDQLIGHLLISGDDTAPPDGDNDWLMPAIAYNLPAGTIKGDFLPEEHRRLRCDFGLLTFDDRAW